VVYFSGPRTKWSGRIDDSEVIARISTRFQWLAGMLARSTHARLDPHRCGYAVLADGLAIEHIEPKG